MGDPKRPDTGEVIEFAGQQWEVRPPAFDPSETYDRYIVVLEGTQPIVGPCAPNLDAYTAMLSARVKAGLIDQTVMDQILAEVREGQRKVLEEDAPGEENGVKKEEPKEDGAAKEIADKAVNATINTFARDLEGKLGLQSYAIRAFVRECLTESGTFVKNKGKNLRERFRLQVGVSPLFIPILSGGKPHVVPDRVDSRPCHVQVGVKKFHSIKTREIIDPPWSVTFELQVGKESTLTAEMIEDAMKLAPTVRLGAERSQEAGSCSLQLWGTPKVTKK
jgi:hypothetical protein